MNVKKNKDVAASDQKSKATPSHDAKRPPVKHFRVEDVTASVFDRQHNGRTYFSVSFTRSYKDAGGRWKYTKYFNLEDLGKIVTVAQQAAEWIHETDSAESMPKA